MSAEIPQRPHECTPPQEGEPLPVESLHAIVEMIDWGPKVCDRAICQSIVKALNESVPLEEAVSTLTHQLATFQTFDADRNMVSVLEVLRQMLTSQLSTGDISLTEVQQTIVETLMNLDAIPTEEPVEGSPVPARLRKMVTNTLEQCASHVMNAPQIVGTHIHAFGERLLRGNGDSGLMQENLENLPRHGILDVQKIPHAIDTIATKLKLDPDVKISLYELTRNIPPGCTVEYAMQWLKHQFQEKSLPDTISDQVFTLAQQNIKLHPRQLALLDELCDTSLATEPAVQPLTLQERGTNTINSLRNAASKTVELCTKNAIHASEQFQFGGERTSKAILNSIDTVTPHVRRFASCIKSITKQVKSHTDKFVYPSIYIASIPAFASLIHVSGAAFGPLGTIGSGVAAVLGTAGIEFLENGKRSGLHTNKIIDVLSPTVRSLLSSGSQVALASIFLLETLSPIPTHALPNGNNRQVAAAEQGASDLKEKNYSELFENPTAYVERLATGESPITNLPYLLTDPLLVGKPGNRTVIFTQKIIDEKQRYYTKTHADGSITQHPIVNVDRTSGGSTRVTIEEGQELRIRSNLPIHVVNRATGKTEAMEYPAIFEHTPVDELPDGFLRLLNHIEGEGSSAIEYTPTEEPMLATEYPKKIEIGPAVAMQEIQTLFNESLSIGPINRLTWIDQKIGEMIRRNTTPIFLGEGHVSGGSDPVTQLVKNIYGREYTPSLVNSTIDTNPYNSERYSLSYLLRLWTAMRNGETLSPEQMFNQQISYNSEELLLEGILPEDYQKIIPMACQKLEEMMLYPFHIEMRNYVGNV